jgi:hypothetical protein
MALYPAHFPCPERQPYSVAVDAGLARTAFASGDVRQRRRYRNAPHLFTLRFVLTDDILAEWQQWANASAYDFFQIDLVSGLARQALYPHEVRFASDLAYDTEGYNRTVATVVVEPSQAMLAGTFEPVDPPAPVGRWIVAGTPANPAARFTDAGTPANPVVKVEQ